MANWTTDHGSGVLQGAADAAQGVKHEIRARGSEQTPSRDRDATIHARWQAGLPARNAVERDGYAAIEGNLAAGMNHLAWQGREASKMEAARTAEAGFEAGQ